MFPATGGRVRYIQCLHIIYLYKVETFPDTNYGQLYKSDKYLNRRFGMFEQDKSNLIILVFMLSIFKFNQSVSVCMLNNLGYWQD